MNGLLIFWVLEVSMDGGIDGIAGGVEVIYSFYVLSLFAK